MHLCARTIEVKTTKGFENLPACLTGKSSCSDMVIWSKVETKFTDLWACRGQKKSYKKISIV